MKDIVPYTEEEAQKLASWFIRLGVSSAGPLVTVSLIMMVEKLDEAVKKMDLTPFDDKRWVLEGFRQRLLDVIAVETSMMGLTHLVQLEALLKAEGTSS